VLAIIQIILSLNHPIDCSSIALILIAPVEVSIAQYRSIIFPVSPAITLLCHLNRHSPLLIKEGLAEV
jgi:hypothetical protein